MGAELTAILDASVGALDADAGLMLRFQAGEDACFEELVDRYRRPLMGFVFRMVRNTAASEDLVQEVFLRVYQHRSRYQPQARFSTWVYRIASHLALNHIRDHRRDRLTNSLDEPAAEGEAPREVAETGPNAEQWLLASHAQATRRDRVRQAIAGLPARQQAAVILHKYQGLDYEEIAKSLELSGSATKSLLFRAYESLRRELKDLL